MIKVHLFNWECGTLDIEKELGISVDIIDFLEAIPRKDCARIAQLDFSSDCLKTTQAYWRKSRSFWAI